MYTTCLKRATDTFVHVLFELFVPDPILRTTFRIPYKHWNVQLRLTRAVLSTVEGPQALEPLRNHPIPVLLKCLDFNPASGGLVDNFSDPTSSAHQ